MTLFPKLKVKVLAGPPCEEIRDFEQARSLPFGEHVLIVVEGQTVESYEELLRLAAQEQHKDKAYLEVLVTYVLYGG